MSENYPEFIGRIKRKLGIDLSLYKEAQMKRRIISLRNKRGYKDFNTYYEALNKDSELLSEFTDRLTINVSEFFRNPQRWEVLKNKVIPSVSKGKTRLNIWSAACSTGEEPYSLSILMKEYFPALKVNILATDIDENILARAKQGIYQKQSLKELPSGLEKKYFVEKNGLFEVNRDVRQLIEFKKHNLLADRYPRDLDLIVCRNVLIYFTDEAKSVIYQNFSNSLKQNGILFVGSTEQIFSAEQYGFSLFDTFFYQKA
ncbi:protein-glutamate O-methyltransferase CheR [Aciduricibacillus chroicocephali]|uniref:protein-glutamate O-methyltransferase n=1 Tax=Aciduricibacillus chroicocephali TaxID=3054939 RepID=A0ABY9KRS2_9BACI|nr:protein-glutamate O-methyltransferase CheR [Bacillaceae bacterium 44XB]